MKCSKCGFDNKAGAKFCTKCGNSLTKADVDSNLKKSNRFNYIIILLIVIIVLFIASIGYFVFNDNSLHDVSDSQNNTSSDDVQSDVNEDNEDIKTQEVSSQKTSTSQVSESKSWESIGVYSGSGSGSQTISVPPGKIMVKLSAYPIKNYATNYLYVTGSNGKSGGVDWGSKSAVETRSDSFKHTSSSQETFTIDYYETVSWEVEFFRYQ